MYVQISRAEWQKAGAGRLSRVRALAASQESGELRIGTVTARMRGEQTGPAGFFTRKIAGKEGQALASGLYVRSSAGSRRQGCLYPAGRSIARTARSERRHTVSSRARGGTYVCMYREAIP